MALWLIEPATFPEDDGWLERKQFARVIVRAENPAFARLAAAELDTPDEASEFGQQDPQLGSAFHSPRLYTVRRFAADQHAVDGPPGVLEAIPR